MIHLESIERQTGERPEQLDGPECPEGFDYLWQYFMDIAASERRSGLRGIEPLHAADIEAWLRLSRHELDCFELECVMELDRKYREINAEKPPKP